MCNYPTVPNKFMSMSAYLYLRVFCMCMQVRASVTYASLCVGLRSRIRVERMRISSTIKTAVGGGGERGKRVVKGESVVKRK